MSTQNCGVRLVHPPEFHKPSGVETLGPEQSRRPPERSPQFGESIFGKTVRRVCRCLKVEDGCDVGEYVPAHGECKLCLSFQIALGTQADDGGGIGHGGESGYPRLIGMMRSKPGQHRKRKLTFEKLRGPFLPVFEVAFERPRAGYLYLEEIRRRRGRSGACIEKRNLELAF